MIRNVIGAVLAVVGAAAAVWSPFRIWYDGRLGRHYRIDDVVGGITPETAGLWTSLWIAMAFAALVALAGVVLRSRLAVALAGVIVLGFSVLWMVRQGQAAGSLTASGDETRGLGSGLGLALAGGVLLLLAAALMAGRRKRHAAPAGRRSDASYPTLDDPHHRHDHHGHDDRHHDDQRGYGDQHYDDQRGYGEQHYDDQRGYGDPDHRDQGGYRNPQETRDYPHPDDRR
ncbi:MULTISPECIES: hypothetical protein [Streptomyces]|uniref:Uncharacterized protein n=1 Tax=Streptomyces changanensis TaxID=2964669 RepID=A0ABY5N6Q1_9ACTN|nr:MULTISPECIES: hypothetical protein [Streptomyces]UUS31642.1 hypothetical protein NRO40_12895 [Streptomyces changanensis]